MTFRLSIENIDTLRSPLLFQQSWCQETMSAGIKREKKQGRGGMVVREEIDKLGRACP